MAIAVVTGGGFGDVLSTSKYIERLYAEAGAPSIDVFYAHKSYLDFMFTRAPYVSGRFPASSVGQLRPNYDAIVEVHRLVKYDLVDPVRLSRLCPKLFWLQDVSERRTGEFALHYREMPFLDGDLAKRAVLKGLNRKSLMGYSGGVDIDNDEWIFVAPAVDALRIFDRVAVTPGQYVTLHDGFDTSHRTAKRSTKQWSGRHWQQLIKKLRAAHPELKIVQVGGSHSQYYPGVDVDLVSKASFDEVAWLLKHAVCHIDSESGLVRLAREVGGKSIVIFGPTDPDFFGFSENVNLRPGKCGNCFWSTSEWLLTCPKGLAEPECTTSIEPERVLAALESVLSERRQAMLNPVSVRFCQYPGLESPTGVGTKNSGPGVRGTQNAVAEQSIRNTVASAGELQVSPLQQLIAEVLHDRITARTANIALVARRDDGEKIEDCLASLSTHTTWFRVDQRNGAKNGKPVVESQNEGADDESVTSSSGSATEVQSIETRYGTPLNVPAGSSTFDVVFLSSAAYDRPWISFALLEMLRILKTNGTLVWTFACGSRDCVLSALTSSVLNLGQLQGAFKNLRFAQLGETIDGPEMEAQGVVIIELQQR